MKIKKETILLAILAFLLLLFIFYWIHFLSQKDFILYKNNISSSALNQSQSSQSQSSKEGYSPATPNLLGFGSFSPSTYGPIQWNSKFSIGKPLQTNLYGVFPTSPDIIENYEDRGSPASSHTVDLPLTTTTSCNNMCIGGRCSYTGQQCLADIDCPGCNGYKSKTNPNAGSASVPGDIDNGKLTTEFTPNYSPLTTSPGILNAAIFSMKNLGKASPPANFGPNFFKTALNYANNRFYDRYKPQPNSLPFQPKYPVSNTVTGMALDTGPLPSNYFE